MSRQYRNYGDDLEADGFEVASHNHKKGHFQSGSAFSRGAADLPPVNPAPQTRRANANANLQLSQRPASLSSLEANRADFDRRYRNEGYGNTDSWSATPIHRSRRPAQEYYDESVYDRQPGHQIHFPHREHKRHGFLKFLIVLIAVFAAVYALVFLPIDNKIAFKDPEAKGVAEATQMHIPLQPYYALLLGSDARENDTVSRADSIILARIDVVANKITMLSIPRDTKIEIPGHGIQKINAAYAFGGAGGMASAVSKLVNVPISKVAVIHFDGLSSLVDAIGGITVNVPVDVNDPEYTGFVLPAGTHQMDGKTALLFSRVRHGFALGDFQRQADQMLVLQAIMSKARTLPPWEMLGVANSMADMMDSSMRCYNMMPIMLRMLGGSPTIYHAALPSTTDYIDGVSYVINDEAATSRLMEVINAGGNPEDENVKTGME